MAAPDLFRRRRGKGSLTIAGGRVIDPQNGIDEKADVVIENGRVARVESGKRLTDKQIEAGRGVLDARGRVVCLVDDVWTTGSTLEEAARAVHGSGAAAILVFAAARV